jgi:hypothetical protein
MLVKSIVKFLIFILNALFIVGLVDISLSIWDNMSSPSFNKAIPPVIAFSAFSRDKVENEDVIIRSWFIMVLNLSS